MIPDLGIYRSANVLVTRHSATATTPAHRCTALQTPGQVVLVPPGLD